MFANSKNAHGGKHRIDPLSGTVTFGNRSVRCSKLSTNVSYPALYGPGAFINLFIYIIAVCSSSIYMTPTLYKANQSEGGLNFENTKLEPV